ncbi:hypothetical protein ZWY2020_034191 [Hordeum vulgare]|nr:hypothetical protein ZWY2020_034191 [Hordeum vulgare]
MQWSRGHGTEVPIHFWSNGGSRRETTPRERREPTNRTSDKQRAKRSFVAPVHRSRPPTTMAEEEAKMPYLPIDMIWEIFLRLPPKPLRRFRAVCHAWRDLATEHYLLLAHHRRQPSDLLIQFEGFVQRRPPSTPDYMDFRVDAVDLRARIIRPVVLFTERKHHLIGNVLQIHGSCGGLLLISFTDYFARTKRLDLCNPATHQWVPLPWIDTYDIAGLYQHGQDYRVLYRRGIRFGANETYLIFSMTSREIRDIGFPVASQSDADAIACLQRGPRHAYLNPPVLLHGNLHWPPRSEESNTIQVFDTEAETFRSMRTSIQPGSVSSLFDMDGTLAMSSRENAMKHPLFVDLWLLQDYEMETWVRSYSIKFKAEEEGIISYRWPRASFVVSRQGDVLVDWWDRLFWYDMGGNLKGNIQGDPRFTQFLLKESLVPLPQQFFQHIAIGDVPAPPYFRGLWP